MCFRMVIRSLLLISLVAVLKTMAEPPTSYGPPSFGSSYRAPASYGGYSGGEGGQPEPYKFNYEVKDAHTGNDYSHHATSDGRRVTGEYRVLLPDGRRQVVKYTADDNGYNADVHYEGQARFPQTSGGGYSSGGGGGGSSFGGYGY